MDPPASGLRELPADDLLEVEVFASTADVRDLVVAAGQAFVATTGGLLVVDGDRLDLDERGCVTLPRSAFLRLGTAEGLPHGTVEDLAVSGDTVWAATHDGLVEVSAKGPVGVRRVVRRGLDGTRLSAVAVHAGAVWVGAHDGGLHRLEGDRLKRVGPAAAGARTTALLSAGALYAGTPRGVLRFDGGRIERLGSVWVTSLARAGDGVLAAGPDGVYRVGPRRLTVLDRLPAARLVEGPRGVTVVAPDGTLRAAGGGLQVSRTRGTLVARASLAGVILLGTDEGLTLLDPAGHLHPVDLGGPPSNALTAVTLAGGRVVVGTEEDGLAALEGRWFRPLVAEEVQAVRALAPAGPDAVWAATPRGLWRVPVFGGEARRLGPAQGLVPLDVQSVVAAPDGTVRVITASGSFRIVEGPEGPVAERETPAPLAEAPAPLVSLGLAQGAGRDLGTVSPGALLRRGGRVLAGTPGGLVSIAGGTLRRYRGRHGLPADEVTALAGDERDIWVATRGGLARLRLAPYGPELAAAAADAGRPGVLVGGLRFSDPR